MNVQGQKGMSGSPEGLHHPECFSHGGLASWGLDLCTVRGLLPSEPIWSGQIQVVLVLLGRGLTLRRSA